MPFTPEQIEGYRERARKNISKLLAGEKMYSRAKRGRRSDLGNIFFRSSWEANYARVLNIEGKKWLYEPEQFVVKDVDSGVSIIYVPDFFLVDEKIYVEVKGWLDNDSKRKIKYFKNTFPDKKLLMVIDAKNKKVVSWLKDNNIDYIDYNELKKKYIEVLVEWEK
jgi:hypothetical protein